MTQETETEKVYACEVSITEKLDILNKFKDLLPFGGMFRCEAPNLVTHPNLILVGSKLGQTKLKPIGDSSEEWVSVSRFKVMLAFKLAALRGIKL